MVHGFRIRGAPVRARMSSAVTPGAVSTSARPAGVTSRTPRSVMTRVVDQAVDLPVLLLQLGGEIGPVLLAGDVEAAAAGCLGHIGGDHPGARGGKSLGPSGPLAASRAGDHDRLAQQPLGVQVRHGRSRLRRRPAGRGTGSTPGTTVLVSVPIPSTVSETVSPGPSGGGVRSPRNPHSSARQPPFPHVPEPRTSPGTTRVPREA